MKRTIAVFGACLLLFSLAGCGNGEKGAETEEEAEEKQMNITLLLDLSDRIDPKKHPASPEHHERDKGAVSSVVSVFKAYMNKQGAYLAKSKIRVLINPLPKDRNINAIMEKMNIDLSEMKKPADKREAFKTMDSVFSENISKIYDLALQQKKYPGSDIWRFFKNDIDLVIEDDPSYRNILVVITDGYVFHEDSKIQEKNRTSWLTGPLIKRYGFRDSKNWRQKFDEGDYGFIATRKDLDNLEVLVLEVETKHTGDEDIIKAYLSKWFDEMGVRKYEIYNSDLPTNTRKRIERFIGF